MAPLRVSLAGGGTDIASFYERFDGGAVLSSSISDFVYVTVKHHDPSFGEKYRIMYSNIDHVNDRNEIENETVRAVLEFLDIDERISVVTLGDLPAQSGLGSSSSYAVALLHALHTFLGHEVSAIQLAEEACTVEIEVMHKPIGRQDQFAAAIGGLNFFEFLSNGRVRVQPISYDSNIAGFFDNLYLVWTQMPRLSEAVLSDQGKRAAENQEALNSLKEMAYQVMESVKASNLSDSDLAVLLERTWAIKKTLSAKASSIEIDATVNRLRSAGFEGGKLAGAGGGGFYLGVANKSLNQDEFRRTIGLPLRKVLYEPRGSRIISAIPW
jgi:D-glycero-alpha-D-manno-heptose-7-phosphate kinase